MEKELIELGADAKEIRKMQEEAIGEGAYDPTLTESQTATETSGVEYTPTETEVTGPGYTPTESEGASLVTVQIDESIPKGLSKFLDPSLMKFISSSCSTMSRAPTESEVITASQMPIMSEAIQSVASQQVSIPGMIPVPTQVPMQVPKQVPTQVPMQVPTQVQTQDSAMAPPIDLSQKTDDDDQTKQVKLSDFFHFKDGCFYYDKCPKDFKWRTDINKHVKKCGLPCDKYICGVCHKELASCNGLKEHMDRHSEMPSVKCNYCGQLFYNKSKRTIHYYSCDARKQFLQDI